VTDPDLEQTLRRLSEVGKVIKDRGYRQVLRFEHGGKAYYVKFYPREGPRDRFRRFFRGSPAVWEFTRLQWLQKAGIPAPRAVAAMVGFQVGERFGDAVILDAIEPSIPLDQYLLQFEQDGKPVPNRRELSQQLRGIVSQLIAAKLGHEDLHLGNFLLHDGKLSLLDGYAVRGDGMKPADLYLLGHSVRRFATTTEMQRGWDQFTGGGPMPAINPVSKPLWDRFLWGISRERRYFGILNAGGWSGVFYKLTKYRCRWSVSSNLEVTHEDWNREWPVLLDKIEQGRLDLIKRSRSGEVLAATVTIGGRDLDVIVKRPRRRYWYRYLNEIGRGSRAWRAWRKTWNLIVRDIPTAWPLLVMEKRRLGYVTDAIFVCEKIPGRTLAHADLDSIAASRRDNLFRRAGRMLRTIERAGFSHFDAKASNWVVFDDPANGPIPVLIDNDGIRRRRWELLGLHRLLRSMHENPQYTSADSLSLCRGYAPYTPLQTEPAPAVESPVAT
jgi:tRNA A-37 threonylcarbamoyl transferase component Bud32